MKFFKFCFNLRRRDGGIEGILGLWYLAYDGNHSFI